MEDHSTVYNFSEWRMFKHFDKSDFMWDFLAFRAYNARKKSEPSPFLLAHWSYHIPSIRPLRAVLKVGYSLTPKVCAISI